jgi:hypothetical protein
MRELDLNKDALMLQRDFTVINLLPGIAPSS